MSTADQADPSPEFNGSRTSVIDGHSNGIANHGPVNLNLSPVSSPYTPVRTPDPWESPEIYDHRTPWSGKLRALDGD